MNHKYVHQAIQSFSKNIVNYAIEPLTHILQNLLSLCVIIF